MVSKKAIVVGLMFLLVGCQILFPSPPPRFPQFAERHIAGPGSYEIPQWSPDGHYLAYFDEKRDPILMVYDTRTDKKWPVVTTNNSRHFSWMPNGDLTYLRYRPDLSGLSFPHISELHRVDVKGENDQIIASNLSSAGDFAWFGDGQRAAILLADPSSHSFCRDVYILDAATGETTLLLKAKGVDLQCVVMLDISPDNTSIFAHGIHEKSGATEAQVVIYSLETRRILERLIPSEIVPSGGITYPKSGLGDSSTFGWVGRRRWILAPAYAPGGECYNYALFFLDTDNLDNSFCIPSVGGAFGDPVLSPDLSKISYITVVGPGNTYVMIGDTSSDLLARLETGSGNK